MGVIKNRKSFQDPYADVEEDPLSDLIESGDDARLANELLDLSLATRRRRRIRRSHGITGLGDVEGLSSRLVGHKSQRKQRRIQNDKQLLATWCAGEDLNEVSIYDFIQDSVSVFALMIEGRDNIALWNALLAAEPENDDEAACHFRRGRKKKFESSDLGIPLSPEDCYSRLDGDMKRTLKRQKCSTDLLRRIEKDLENFFTASPCDVYKTHIDNSFSRLLLHAACEYMDLRSKSVDCEGTRWTFVKNPREKFVLPTTPLSTYLESRRRLKR